MTDYITRDAAIEAVRGRRLSPCDSAYTFALDHAEAAIRAIPSQPAGDYEALCVRLDAYRVENGMSVSRFAPKITLEAAAAIRALVERVRELEAVNAAHGEIICRKCGRRQDGPKVEAGF